MQESPPTTPHTNSKRHRSPLDVSNENTCAKGESKFSPKVLLLEKLKSQLIRASLYLQRIDNEKVWVPMRGNLLRRRNVGSLRGRAHKSTWDQSEGVRASLNHLEFTLKIITIILESYSSPGDAQQQIILTKIGEHLEEEFIWEILEWDNTRKIHPTAVRQVEVSGAHIRSAFIITRLPSVLDCFSETPVERPEDSSWSNLIRKYERLVSCGKTKGQSLLNTQLQAKMKSSDTSY